jgi:hypothetical protein
MHRHVAPGQEYVACDRSGYRYRVDFEQTDLNYVQVIDLADGTQQKVKPENLHTDPKRRTGYLLAELVDVTWMADPRTQSAVYRTQVARASGDTTDLLHDCDAVQTGDA